MDNCPVCPPFARFAPYRLLPTAEEQHLLQYYRQLSQNDRGIVRRVAQALAGYSAKEQGMNT